MIDSAPPIDDRSAAEIWQQLRERSRAYLSGLFLQGSSAGLGQVFARYLEAVLQRLNQAPEKNRLAFFDVLGLGPVPAQSSRAPIVFQLTPGTGDSAAPAGTQVAAPPPPGATTPIVFETESATGVAAASLSEVVSLWPGRDEYIDHSADLKQGTALTLFDSKTLGPTPHILYLAHDTLLALAGSSQLRLEVNLAGGSSAPLEILWEYWDGKVWRGFKSLRASCAERAGDDSNDGTRGLTRSGSINLSTDCAKTALLAVNGVESFWIRGRLTQTLPPDPTQFLPTVESLGINTQIQRPLSVRLQAKFTERAERQVFLTDALGSPLYGVAVRITSFEDKVFEETEASLDRKKPDISVSLRNNLMNLDSTYLFEAPYIGVPVAVETINDQKPMADVVVKIDVDGLALEKAFAGSLALDVTKPFYPFGQQPQPGATFYFSQSEVLGKPDASVKVYALGAKAPQDFVLIGDSDELPHTVSWEYWDGQIWKQLLVETDSGDLKDTQFISFDVPKDLEPTGVNGQKGLWMRVRLVSGGFGFKRDLTFATTGGPVTVSYVITQPPVLADFRMGYTWQDTKKLDHVFTYNDFQYEDHTDDARWPGSTFPAYRPVADMTPAVYLGFDGPLPVADMGLYFGAVEQPGDDRGPALVWEYWNGGGWRELAVADGTRRLRLPGIVSFIAPGDSQPLPRFDAPLHWLRARLKEDGPPGEPTITTVVPNAVWASQRRTFRDLALGTSNGLADATFVISQAPVLAGERIEVRELQGARANVEWRLLALELSGRNQDLVRTFEQMLGSEGSETDFIGGDLRLRRDRTKRVIEAWVRWEGQPHLFFSGPSDRHYVLDRALGHLHFGDGVRGRIPPLGAAILAREFRSGGGLAGNVKERSISQLLGSVPGVQSVFNARSAEGGADGETLTAFSRRAPAAVRHRGRALTPNDYEALAREASASVGFARAIPGRRPDGRKLPGYVTLVIVPQSQDPRPTPSFGLREQVRSFLEEHAPCDVAGDSGIEVVGPDYFPLDVSATLVPVTVAEAGAIELRAREAIQEFLHPLYGGPEGRGWELGRDVYLSDVASVLGAVEGVDYVQELALLINGGLQGDRVLVGADRIVVAGQILLKLVEDART